MERFHAAWQKPVDESRSAAEQRQRAAEKASVVYWLAMFGHPLQDNEFDSGIVSALAMLGLDEQGHWKAACNYTPTLSAVIITMRAIVVYRGCLGRR